LLGNCSVNTSPRNEYASNNQITPLLWNGAVNTPSQQCRLCFLLGNGYWRGKTEDPDVFAAVNCKVQRLVPSAVYKVSIYPIQYH
jgi:hypothetical protein